MFWQALYFIWILSEYDKKEKNAFRMNAVLWKLQIVPKIQQGKENDFVRRVYVTFKYVLFIYILMIHRLVAFATILC